MNLGGRVNPDPFHAQSSALTNGFIRANGVPPSPYSQQYSPFTNQDDSFPPLKGRQASIDITVPTIDTSYASHPGSNYGSPRDDDIRFGLGLSPVATKGLSVLDAPLPSSFDSNGVSYYARQGPIASSVPTKFGIESPPGSVGTPRDGRTSEALKNLHSSAFGDDTRDRFNGIPSSPPTEEYFGKRTMHSQRFAKNKVMSASLPKAVDLDWEAGFTFEEDYLPDTLKDLMTPQEKARRGSRNADDEGRLHSGTGTPNNESTSKFGSPSNASPSRWGPLFQRHQQQKEEEEKAAASRASAFGHVGSPLRNSSLHPGASPSSRPIVRTSVSGDTSPFIASPPRQSSMSIISQQLQRTRLSRAEPNGSESGLHPVTTGRVPSNPIGSGAGRPGLVADRQVSSSSIGNGGSGRFTTPIGEEQEEQGEFVFNMDDMEADKKGEKRHSGGFGFGNSNRSPQTGPTGNSRNGLSSAANGGVDGMFGARWENCATSYSFRESQTSEKVNEASSLFFATRKDYHDIKQAWLGSLEHWSIGLHFLYHRKYSVCYIGMVDGCKRSSFLEFK